MKLGKQIYGVALNLVGYEVLWKVSNADLTDYGVPVPIVRGHARFP